MDDGGWRDDVGGFSGYMLGVPGSAYCLVEDWTTVAAADDDGSVDVLSKGLKDVLT